MALTEKLTSIADAIRTKTGSADKLTLDGMAQAIAGIETGGADNSGGLIDGTLTEYRNIALTKIRNYAFYYHPSIERIFLPNLQHANYTAPFRNCSALKVVDIGVSSAIGSAAFPSCPLLKTIVIRRTDGVCSLLGINTFNSTPFASGGTGGTVYVPQALIESYKTATNWSTLYAAGTCNFVALEGSEYE